MIDTSNPVHVHVDERLRSDLMIWLSSVKPDGKAHLVPVWFLWDGEAVYIFSKPDQKVRNIKHNTSVMLGLDDTDGGEDPIMITGEAEILPPGVISTASPAYEEKYAAKLAEFNWTGESMSKAYTEAIKITPTKLFR